MSKNEEKKVRGSNCIPPNTLRTHSGPNQIAWAQSLDAQLKHQQIIMEEARRCADRPSYQPVVKIGKRFKKFFETSVSDARTRNKRKRRKN
jgi:hypothetical protein